VQQESEELNHEPQIEVKAEEIIPAIEESKFSADPVPIVAEP